MKLFPESINFLKYSKFYFWFSGIITVLAIISLVVFGLKLGIDFTGGSLLEVRYENNIPEPTAITEIFKAQGLDSFQKQTSQDNAIIFRFQNVSEDVHKGILDGLLTDEHPGIELRFDTIGAVVGSELKTKSFQVLTIAILAIALFVGWAFRRTSGKIRSWRFGVVTLITLAHDVIITVGIFVVLSHYFVHAEIGTPFIAALLTVLGYSVSDTIVVFDRIREHLLKSIKHQILEEVVNRSLRETMTRSINTSLTTVLALLAIFFFGGETIQYFVLTLAIGIIFGTYSSIFIASPLLFWWAMKTDQSS